MTTLFPLSVEGTVKVAERDVPALMEDEGGSFFTLSVPDDVPLDDDQYWFEQDGQQRSFAVRHLAKDESGPGGVVYKYVCQWTEGGHWPINA
jgi:hypothetical protein